VEAWSIGVMLLPDQGNKEMIGQSGSQPERFSIISSFRYSIIPIFQVVEYSTIPSFLF
jgi:hypothetical protein